MAVLPPVPDVCRVAVSGTFGTKKWANIFHVNPLGDGTGFSQAVVDDVAAVVFAAYAGLIQQCPDVVAATQCVATDLTNNTGRSGIVTGSHAGGNGGTPSPSSNGLLINWHIATRYRGGHPRTYLPGVPEASVDGNGVLTPLTVTTENTNIATFLGALSGNAGPSGSLKLCTVHYRVHNAPIVAPAVPPVDIIASGTCNSIIGTQRRRIR